MNWEFDIESRTARHKCGLRVRFLPRNGDWRATPILPLPPGLNPTHVPHLLRESNLWFVTEWRNRQRASVFIGHGSAGR